MSPYLSDAKDAMNMATYIETTPLCKPPNQRRPKPNQIQKALSLFQKWKNPTHKKIIKETQVQNIATTNPFAALAQEDTQQKSHLQETQQIISPNLPASQETQHEIQTKKQKRDTSPLLLEYPSTNTQNLVAMEITKMEESNNSKVESLLEGVNLQVVITTYQAKRQDMIPQDLI